MLRILVALITVCFSLATAAQADILVVKGRDGKPRFMGVKGDVDLQNVNNFVDKSDGVIWADNHDGVIFKKNDRAKSGQTFPRKDVIAVLYSTEPDGLLDGFDSMRTGAWGAAIGAFRDVYNNKEERAVFRLEAYFQIGICYANMGNYKRAIGTFQRWPSDSKSKYTPEVHRILAEIYTSQKKFKNARARYAKIGEIAGISRNWQHRASLGAVKVDIAERKYQDGEQSAKRIASIVSQDRELGDAHCLALTLQAQAILEAKDAERLPAAEKLLMTATAIKDVSDTNRAFSNLMLGHVMYAQQKGDEARYPYLRVACLYPGERGYVASALQNAGQCFIELAMHPDNAGKPISDDLFMKGMKLLAECGRNYRGTESASKAAGTYRQHKARYEELKAKADAEEDAPPSEDDSGK